MKSVGLIAGHAIPRLGRTNVVIVDRVHVLVLHVPAKAGEEHANVEPRLRAGADGTGWDGGTEGRMDGTDKCIGEYCSQEK